MSKEKYTEKSALEKIRRNGGKVAGKQISGPFGINTLGAVDYLRRKHGYTLK